MILPYVVLEAHGSPTWLPVGFPLAPTDDPGSVTSDEPDGRQLYVFGWLGGTADLQQLSTLDEPYELLIYRPAGLRLLRVRYVR